MTLLSAADAARLPAIHATEGIAHIERGKFNYIFGRCYFFSHCSTPPWVVGNTFQYIVNVTF